MVDLVRSGRTPEALSREFEPTAQAIWNWALPGLRKTLFRTDNTAFGLSSTFASDRRLRDLAPPSSRQCRFPCSSGSRNASVTWAAHYPLYFVDSNCVELCNLLPRHPVARQGADATVLGSGYLADLTPDRRPSPYLLLIGWCFDIRCTRRHLRRDCEDTWLARLLLS
jgi:hypothetical protein